MRLEMISWTKERHSYWWEFLLTQASVPTKFDIYEPEIEFYSSTGKVSGRAWNNKCAYNVNYLFLSDDNSYDSTIAHEICHVFTGRVIVLDRYMNYRMKGHCNLWCYLYRVVCGFNSETNGHKLTPLENSDPNIQAFRMMQKIKQLESELSELPKNTA